MAGDQEPGRMDNPYYEWSPITARPRLVWPGGARVAVCVIVSIEQLEWFPPRNGGSRSSAVRIGAYPAVFDISEVSHHEYGNRVGIFRVMKVLDECGVKVTAAIDRSVAEGNAFVVRQGKDRGWEFIGRGLSSSRMITERMSEAEEREYIRGALDGVRGATGATVGGWVSVDYGESTRTVRLLAEMGVRYVCDWANDEQPYRMKVPSGEMVSLPVSIELDDVFAQRERGVTVQRWLDMVREAFDRLYWDGMYSGRLLVLHIHPYVSGQPFRIKYLKEALGHITRRDGVWLATGTEVVDFYLAVR